MDRMVGSVKGNPEGNCLIIICGIHGNESSGVEAAEEIFNDIQQFEINGELHILRGNLSALRESKRYIDKDLNRLWLETEIDLLNKNMTNMPYAESLHLKEMAQKIFEITKGRRSKTLILDLHSSSSKTQPFGIGGGEELFGKVCRKLDIPIVSDPLDFFFNALFSWSQRIGISSLAFEAGEHNGPSTANYHKCAILNTMTALDLIDNIPEKLRRKEILNCEGLISSERDLEVVYRHRIEPHQNFRMFPGFSNFTPIKKDQIIAEDINGKVHAACDGLIFLPLYQKVGAEGFFIVK